MNDNKNDMVSLDSIIALLKHQAINDILNSSKDNKVTDGFNIFKVLGIEEKEVIICRLLGEFLDPNGSHGLGHLPLKLFVQNVLQIEDEKEESLKSANILLEEAVTTDDSAKSYRRVDISIHTQMRVYPVEVKIWAGDQPNQLYDYYHYYFEKEEAENKIYYLTPNGHEPSKYSTKGLKQYVLLSFNENDKGVADIKSWLESLLELVDAQNDNHRKCMSIIKQFIEVIKEMNEESNNTTVEIIKKEIIDTAISEDNCDAKAELNALAFLCCDRERAKDLLLDIQTKYILKYVNCDRFTFSPVCDDNKPDEYSDEARVHVTMPDREDFEAWLSVGGNGLYVITTKVKVERWNNGKNKCSWKYIRRGNKYYDMKSFDYKKIDISSELNEVLKAFDDKVSAVNN